MDHEAWLRQLAGGGKQDQLEAASREFAGMVATYYHHLLAHDLPETLAGYLTGQFQNMLLARFIPYDRGIS